MSVFNNKDVLRFLRNAVIVVVFWITFNQYHIYRVRWDNLRSQNAEISPQETEESRRLKVEQQLEGLYRWFSAENETTGRYIVNPPTSGETYCVFSANSPVPARIMAEPVKAYNYVFYMPLTVMAWRRIGVKTIILLTGYMDAWREDEKLKFVLTQLIQQDVTLVFFKCPYASSDIFGRLARLYSISLIPWEDYIPPGRDDLLKSTKLIVTDADMWPLKKNWFLKDLDGDGNVIHTFINSYNGSHASTIDYLNKNFTRICMATVGMSLYTWKQFSPEKVRNSSDLFAHLKQTFSNFQIEKPKRFEFHLDERILSYKWHTWRSHHQRESVIERRRHALTDRICRFHIKTWNVTRVEERHIDVHLFRDGSDPQHWHYIKHILRLMYRNSPASLDYIMEYYRHFISFE